MPHSKMLAAVLSHSQASMRRLGLRSNCVGRLRCRTSDPQSPPLLGATLSHWNGCVRMCTMTISIRPSLGRNYRLPKDGVRATPKWRRYTQESHKWIARSMSPEWH